jgi:pyruvate dehydrogenase E1 component alpha subunit
MVQNAICQEELYRFADPYKIPGVRVDGMDVMEVYAAVSEAAARAREGKGPTLVEAITYRFRGHSMSDPAEYRSKREERIWQARDPLKRFRGAVMGEQRVSAAGFDAIDAEVAAAVEDAVRYAEESPEPELSELERYVYVEKDGAGA